MAVDADAVKSSITAHERCMAVIDQKIEDLVKKIRRLQFQRSQHQEEVKKFHGMITLARRLPVEILAAIFEECVHNGWTRTPLTVSHVCSEWRKAAADVATVWSHVYINLDGRYPFERTRLWLEKARTCPLRITLEVGKDDQHLPRVLDLILSRVSQWQYLHIRSLLLSHANRILTLWNKPAPQLATIDITIIQEFEVQEPEIDDHQLTGLNKAFSEAPLLRTIKMTRNLLPSLIPFSITTCYLSLPSVTPTTLAISSVIQLLESLPLLELFSMTVPFKHPLRFEPEPNVDRSIFLPNLRSLILMGGPDIFQLLSHLRATSLTYLNLLASNDPRGPDVEIGQCLKVFIDSASPPLESLDIRDINIPFGPFYYCLQKLRDLKELRLHDSDVDDSFMQNFIILRGSESPLCPQLTSLDLRWCSYISGRILVAIMQSRQALQDSFDACPVAAMGAITVINCSHVHDRDIFTMAEMVTCRVIMPEGDYCRES